MSRQELCRELEARAVAYRGLRERLQRLLDSCRAGRPCSTEHSLRLLEQKWESVQDEAQERKVCGVLGGCDPRGAPPARTGSGAAGAPSPPVPAAARRSAWPRG